MLYVMLVLQLLSILQLFLVAGSRDIIEVPDDHGNPVKVPVMCRSTRELHGEVDVRSKVRFYLFTRVGSTVDMQRMKLGDPLPNTFHRQTQTKIIIHGFINTLKSKMIQSIKDAYLDPQRNMNVNVIAVDWGDLAGLSVDCYYGPKKNTKVVGPYVAQFIQNLVETGAVALHQVHMIGHSLGAHVAGIAGKNVPSGKVARITGLDPAGVLYDSEPTSSRLAREDAAFVDVIHTDVRSLGLGFRAPCGHADFYPHGGGPQPACHLLPTCSHSRAHQYYALSVRNASEYRAYPCYSLDDVTGCSEEAFSGTSGCSGCGNTSSNFMGEGAMLLVPGSLYFSYPDPPLLDDWEQWGKWTLLGGGLAAASVCAAVGVRYVVKKRRDLFPLL